MDRYGSWHLTQILIAFHIYDTVESDKTPSCFFLILFFNDFKIRQSTHCLRMNSTIQYMYVTDQRQTKLPSTSSEDRINLTNMFKNGTPSNQVGRFHQSDSTLHNHNNIDISETIQVCLCRLRNHSLCSLFMYENSQTTELLSRH